MNIIISNCNNIESGTIVVSENCLNIKYAVNGSGKTTIENRRDGSIELREQVRIGGTVPLS